MKTMLIAALALAANFPFDAQSAERAANDAAVADFRAAATDAGTPTAAGSTDARGPDCSVEHLSLIWGPDRQPGAYECFARPKTR